MAEHYAGDDDKDRCTDTGSRRCSHAMGGGYSGRRCCFIVDIECSEDTAK